MLDFPLPHQRSRVPSALCLCVYLSVSALMAEPFYIYTDLKFSAGIDLDNISDEFEAQGHRSKVKVAGLTNVIF